MLKSIMFIGCLLFGNAVWSQTTLPTVTTADNVTTNTIRIAGQGNIGSSGSGEIVLGILNTPISNDTRTFIGWKGDAATNTITNGPAGTLLLQARSDLTYAPIDFATGSATPQLRMRIAGNGNVAIGNNSLTPSSKLLISGSGSTSSTSSLLIQNSSNTAAFRVLDNGYVGVGAGISVAFPESKLAVYTPYGDPLPSDLTLERSVGGDVIGSVRFATGYINPSNQIPFWAGIQSYATGGIDQMDLRFYTSYGSGQLNLERMRIDQYGNIGINTSSPNYNAKLDVNGNIFTSGKIAIGITDPVKINAYSLAVNGSAIFTKAVVKLNSAWPDYVFKENYKLPKLDSLDRFIKSNGHLPEVPKAGEVETNGIDLGKNQVLLLKKIEELTLIVIDQNKRIEKLEKENQSKLTDKK